MSYVLESGHWVKTLYVWSTTSSIFKLFDGTVVFPWSLLSLQAPQWLHSFPPYQFTLHQAASFPVSHATSRTMACLMNALRLRGKSTCLIQTSHFFQRTVSTPSWWQCIEKVDMSKVVENATDAGKIVDRSAILHATHLSVWQARQNDVKLSETQVRRDS